ncbi:hypothetical protein VM1G_03676 [Cytospora mali]|uniref:Thermolabile hemolysin n=1 Tax=Cytospora mali TaxID=578113 RepID=A0A194VWN9_CYTMA|nr:hypothetical protein VM1G_03676 [Valsa mali]
MMRLVATFQLLLWLTTITSAALTGSATLKNFSTLITFGDSYTDDGPEYYTPEPSEDLYTGIHLYDYAVSGSFCDRYFSPSSRNGIKQDQIPHFLNDTDYVGNGSLFNPEDETIYAIWIGTNDLGPSAFFTDNRPTLTILDYVDCVYEQFDILYEAGARNFMLLNLAPLNYAPMYALPENGGTLGSPFWKDEANYNTNVTQVSEKMRQYVALVNSIYDYRTPTEVQISDRYPESSFTIFDVHSLLSDIWHNPGAYLNGTAPLNVTSTIEACGSACSNTTVRDSYMWWDTLHPSEQTDRIIAQEFVNIVEGNGTWSKTWSSLSA